MNPNERNVKSLDGVGKENLENHRLEMKMATVE
jgi:hypothetical protein